MLQIQTLAGKRGLVVGIANPQSIAWGCARAFHAAGAQLAVTWLNDKAEPHVRPLAAAVDASIAMPCRRARAGSAGGGVRAIEANWGELDFVLHSIAFAPIEDLRGRLLDSGSEGFGTAMDVSCHSFIRMARLAEPLMTQGGCLLTVSFYGAEKVAPGYAFMSPVKAALEASVRVLASELGPQRVRVHALSPGVLATRAASGLVDLPGLQRHGRRRRRCPAGWTSMPSALSPPSSLVTARAPSPATSNTSTPAIT
jgi:enoyl-[acyl-carrier protein] reductase I